MGLEGAIRNCLVVVLLCFHCVNSEAQELSKKEKALIIEAYNVQKELGNIIWTNWNTSLAPLLFISGDYQYLINHPKPPSNYKLHPLKLFNTLVHYSKNEYEESVQAVFPVNGVSTMVMTAPSNDDAVLLWIMKFQHEHFHIYQEEKVSEKLKIDLEFRKGFSSQTNELSYPYPYDLDTLMAHIHREGQLIFELLSKDSMTIDDQKAIGDINESYDKIFIDTNTAKYKKWMEWKEGVARYTEYRFALLVSDSTLYKPIDDFTNFYSISSYSNVSKYYSERSLINPIKFVGKGVKGIVLFYYLGLGKALVLDKYYPEWKIEYFNNDLDELIMEVK